MKVLIQNCVTRRFLGERGAWHRSAAKAKDFKAGTEAIDYYVTHGLEDVQIVLHFDFAPRLNIELPLTNSGRPVVLNSRFVAPEKSGAFA